MTINTIDMHSSIKGIAGNAIQPVKALELPEPSEDAEVSEEKKEDVMDISF